MLLGRSPPNQEVDVRTGNGLLTSGWEGARGLLLATGPVSSVAARLATAALKRTQKGREDEWTGLAVQPYTVLSPEIW
jgi:hypothetical protein